MKEFNIYKVFYDWYEGEHEEVLLGKKVDTEEFEKNLGEARDFAQNLIGKKRKLMHYLGTGYSVECLPQYYEQILWFLTKKKGYKYCNFDAKVSYKIDDERNGRKIAVKRKEKSVLWQTLKKAKLNSLKE